jgi:hypothetical protein
MEQLRTPESIQTVDGGHMTYDKCIVELPEGGAVFIKAHNPALFTSAEAEVHTLAHLRREGAAYELLRTANYPHIPQATYYDQARDVLYLTAHTPHDGWNWELPGSPHEQQHYVHDILAALQALEAVDTQRLGFEPANAIDVLLSQGWGKLHDPALRQAVVDRLDEFAPGLHPHVRPGINSLKNLVMTQSDECFAMAQSYAMLPRTRLAHFDARQSNIAWNSSYGPVLVDWSWISMAPTRSDTTGFLIDVFKSGYDATTLLTEHFDPAFAMLQLGYWAVRSTHPSPLGVDTVRFHQLASAVSAATLLD